MQIERRLKALPVDKHEPILKLGKQDSKALDDYKEGIEDTNMQIDHTLAFQHSLLEISRGTMTWVKPGTG
eukprot:6925729-Prorocentrum_lima.AAC.1